MTTSLTLHTLSRDDVLAHIDALADILENCVNGGASVSFMLPFTHEKACAFWLGVAESVGRRERTVLACADELCLTVFLHGDARLGVCLHVSK